jgi:hypothetical protein
VILGELIDGMFGGKQGTDGPKREPRIVDDNLRHGGAANDPSKMLDL